LFYRNLTPGGYIELADIAPLQCDDNSVPDDSPVQQWARHMMTAASNLGRPMNAAKTHKKYLEDAGFVNVTQVIYKWPSNQWPKDPKYKELGKLSQLVACETF
jgi:hypothetical protein